MGCSHNHRSVLDLVTAAYSRFHYLATATLPRSPVSTITVGGIDDIIILHRGPLPYAWHTSSTIRRSGS
jgi:hypothetical protein